MRLLILVASAGILVGFTIYVYWYEASAQRARASFAAKASAKAVEG
jgi:hypothetical protein